MKFSILVALNEGTHHTRSRGRGSIIILFLYCRRWSCCSGRHINQGESSKQCSSDDNNNNNNNTIKRAYHTITNKPKTYSKLGTFSCDLQIMGRLLLVATWDLYVVGHQKIVTRTHKTSSSTMFKNN